MKKIAIYPGSFDPITNGHLDIIERASKLFDLVYVTISLNISKNIATYSIEERTLMLKIATKNLNNVVIDHFEGLVVDYAIKKSAKVIVKGIRNSIDLTAELTQFKFNRERSEEIDTIILLPTAKNIFISSSTVKELLTFNGDVQDYVPKEVLPHILKKFNKT